MQLWAANALGGNDIAWGATNQTCKLLPTQKKGDVHGMLGSDGSQAMGLRGAALMETLKWCYSPNFMGMTGPNMASADYNTPNMVGYLLANQLAIRGTTAWSGHFDTFENTWLHLTQR